MKLTVIIAISMIYALGLIACTSSKKKIKEVQEVIGVGNGGGFAGKEISYVIQANGTLIGDGESFKKIRKETLDQLLSNLSVLGIDKLEYNEPGNMYNFVEFMKEGQMKRIAWDPMNNNVPSSLILFYNNLMQIVKNSKK